MKFGPVPVAESEGAILAHALQLDGKRLKKGRVLSTTDVEAITQAGKKEVIAARLGPEDVEENEAASQIAGMVAHDSVRAADAFTGRVNFYAQQSGCFSASQKAVDQLNRIDPALTLATLDDGEFVEEGRMVATVKIIPFAAPAEAMAQVQAIAGEGAVFRVAPAKLRNAALIATELPSLKSSVMDKTAKLLQRRLDTWNCKLIDEERVAHEAQAVAAAIESVVDEADLVIVFGASAITDERDVIPAAIRKAGGAIHRFGMPVDPGNLLLTGEVAGKPVVGAPGCARSPAENGFDWVLQRIVCGLPVDDAYITGLGVGGLLMEIHDRPQPREG